MDESRGVQGECVAETKINLQSRETEGLAKLISVRGSSLNDSTKRSDVYAARFKMIAAEPPDSLPPVSSPFVSSSSLQPASAVAKTKKKIKKARFIMLTPMESGNFYTLNRCKVLRKE